MAVLAPTRIETYSDPPRFYDFGQFQRVRYFVHDLVVLARSEEIKKTDKAIITAEARKKKSNDY